ncbi:MAG: hypothetical protein LRS48_05700 [Desulfurococcales archaeon]|nr:hypothetical protein [Desulfurococcales archaeon]
MCPRCQSLVDRGVYDSVDVSVMRALLDVEDRLGGVSVRFVKSRVVDGVLVVVVETRGGSVPVWLGEEIRKRVDLDGVRDVLVVEGGRDPLALLERLISPFKVLAVNKSYLPDGSVAVVLKLPAGARRLLAEKGAAVRVVLDMLREKYSGEIYIEYEEQGETGSVKLSKPDLKKLLGGLDRY